MVARVAPAVEDREHAVADELLDLAAEPPGDQRRSDAPVRVEDGSELGRGRALGEAREPHEVTEENADVLVTLPRRRQVEMPKPLVAPFATHGEADDQ